MITIEVYLQGLFDYQFADRNFQAVLLKRGIASGADQASVSAEVKELLCADLLMIMFTVLPRGSESVSKGNWKHTTGAVYVAEKDRKAYQAEANRIYVKHGELVSFGMKDGTNLW